MSRVGYGFLGVPDVKEIASVSRRAEVLGFDPIWMTETTFTREAISPLAAIAASTSKMKVHEWVSLFEEHLHQGRCRSYVSEHSLICGSARNQSENRLNRLAPVGWTRL